MLRVLAVARHRRLYHPVACTRPHKASPTQTLVEPDTFHQHRTKAISPDHFVDRGRCTTRQRMGLDDRAVCTRAAKPSMPRRISESRYQPDAPAQRQTQHGRSSSRTSPRSASASMWRQTLPWRPPRGLRDDCLLDLDRKQLDGPITLTDATEFSSAVLTALDEQLVRVHAMASCYDRYGHAWLERFQHNPQLLLDLPTTQASTRTKPVESDTMAWHCLSQHCSEPCQ